MMQEISGLNVQTKPRRKAWNEARNAIEVHRYDAHHESFHS